MNAAILQAEHSIHSEAKQHQQVQKAEHTEPLRGHGINAHEHARTPAFGPSENHPGAAYDFYQPHYKVAQYYDRAPSKHRRQQHPQHIYTGCGRVGRPNQAQHEAHTLVGQPHNAQHTVSGNRARVCIAQHEVEGLPSQDAADDFQAGLDAFEFQHLKAQVLEYAEMLLEVCQEF